MLELPASTKGISRVNQLDQLWSVANLCTRKKGLGTSIFEVSLARDRHDLPSLFRLVTHRPVGPLLRVLTYPLGSLGRESDGNAVAALRAAICEYHPDTKPPKGNDTQFWIENCVWDIRNDQSNIANANLIKLIELSALDGRCLLPEHAQVLLTELREWAKRAGEARWIPDHDKKIIERAFGARSGSSLKQMIYKVFDEEVGQRRLGEVIEA